MANSGWKKADEPPKPEDCGPNGRIIVWHRYNGAMIANVQQLAENHFMGWWMPYPEAPEGAKEIIEEERRNPFKKL